MSFGRSAREEDAYRRSLYPGTEILRNRLDIRDAKRLEAAERYLVDRRLREGLPPDARNQTYAGFKAIHRHLFQDVYDWAGQERHYTTGRGQTPFAVPEYIAPWMEKRFALLKAENHLIGLKPADFAKRAAEHVNEINAAHPFIDGNGRTQRVWLRALADKAGLQLTLTGKDREAWNAASKIGFERSDHKPMADLLRDRLQERVRERGRGRDTGGRER